LLKRERCPWLLLVWLVWLVCHNEGVPILLNEDDFYGLPFLLIVPVRDSPIERTSLFFLVFEGIFFDQWFSMDRSHLLAEQVGF
jgi:hypothetical protein